MAVATDDLGNTGEAAPPAAVTYPRFYVATGNDAGPYSLRQAILDANANPGLDTIWLYDPDDRPDGVLRVALDAPLPEITDAVNITTDGLTAFQVEPVAGTADYDGLVVAASDGSFTGMRFTGFRHGVVVRGSGNWLGLSRTQSPNVGLWSFGNAGDGVRVAAGTGNRVFRATTLFGNGGLAVDLGGDGPTPDDAGDADADAGPNGLQNHPVLADAVRTPTGGTRVRGVLDSTPLTRFFVDFYAAPPEAGGRPAYLGSATVTTGADGHAAFDQTLGAPAGGQPIPYGYVITAVATDPGNSTSEFSASVPVDDGLPPAATGATYGWGGDARLIRVTFSEDVGESLQAGDPVVRPSGGGGGVAATSVSFDRATNAATFRFADLLPDGGYRATLGAGGVTDAAGHPMAADYTFDFFVLAGDANRDRVVNFADLLALARNYNKTGATWADGDFTGDGVVNFDDLLVLAKNYNKTLPATGAAPTAAATIDVQALAAAMGIAVPTSTTPPAKATPPTPPTPAKKPPVSPKPAPNPAPVIRAAAPTPVAAKPNATSVLRDDDKAKPVFSTSPVAGPAPAKPKAVAKAAGR